MDCRILEKTFQTITKTEIGPKLMPAYASAMLEFLEADVCYVVQKRDEWTASVLYSSLETAPHPSFNPAQLIDLTETSFFFYEPAFLPRRILKGLLGNYRQVAGLRLDHYTFKGWILIGWEQPTSQAATDVENSLYRFGDKVLINYLSLQSISLEQQYRFLFSVMPQAIVLVNESDNFGWVNQAAIELLELDMADPRPPAATLSAAMLQLRGRALNQDNILAKANELLQNPGFVSKEWIWMFEAQILSVLTRPIFSPYFRGRIWVFNDITELYTRTQQLSDAYTEIENLVSVIAHDLKSPLTTLSFIFNFLPMHGPLNDEQQENVDYGQKTIRRGLNLIDSIVYFNKLITSNQPVHRVDTDLNDVLDIVVDGFSAQASQKEIGLHIQLPSQPVVLHTDPESLVRILDNLISNALKFSPFGRNVYVGADMRDNELVIWIRDEGPGIPPADQPRLFKRFQRLSAQPTNNEGSSGLGLSIVKTLSEKIGATIEVESTLDVGTTFRLVFPPQHVQFDNDQAIDQNQEHS